MNELESSSNLRIILLRSGSTELDDQGRIVGSLDLPLSDIGIEEVRQSVTELAAYQVDGVVTAVSKASQQTGQMVAQAFQLKAKVERALTNLDCGLWHGKRIDELRETQPSLFKQWKECPEKVCPPEGETVSEVRQRVAVVLKKLLRKHRKGVLLIVAPEPLLGIIHREIQPPAEGEVCQPLKPGQWKIIEPLVVA